MLIPTTLFSPDGPIARGLLDGSLARRGSVVYDIATGKFVKHLLEVQKLPLSLSPQGIPGIPGVGTFVQGVINAAGHATTLHKVHRVHQEVLRVQQTVSAVLQVSQIAAAASVLNLGVSVAGFAYMGYKLNQLQGAISEMKERMDTRFDRVDGKLDAIAGQLGYLAWLTEANREEQQRLGESLAEIHRALLVSELAELQSWLDQLSRFPDDSPKDAIRVASKARRVLADQAVRATPALDPRVMLVADVAIRGWAVATTTEAQLLVQTGRFREAQALVAEEHPRFTQLAGRWGDALVSDTRPQLGTAYRFGTAKFRAHILPERVARIARISTQDSTLSDGQRRRALEEAEIEFQMSRNAALPETWIHRQVAIAEYLDGLSELADRIGSVGAFARECEARNVGNGRELLPAADSEPGYYLLSATV
jgi:hypothetical protein